MPFSIYVMSPFLTIPQANFNLPQQVWCSNTALHHSTMCHRTSPPKNILSLLPQIFPTLAAQV